MSGVVGEHLELLASVLCSAVAVPYVALWQDPSLLAVLVKILPCVFLFLYLSRKHLEDKRWRIDASSLETLLGLVGIESSTSEKEQRSAKHKKETGGKGSQRQALRRRQLREGVAFGLLCSLVGDVLLVWIYNDVAFILGMLAFGAAQIFYIRGLGFARMNKLAGAAVYAVLLGVTALVLKDAPLVFRLTVPLYAITISTMLWRAADRYEEDDGRSTMQKYCTVIGALAFVVSDTSIAVSKFVLGVEALNLVAASALVHTTYYLAQTLLALGAV